MSLVTPEDDFVLDAATLKTAMAEYLAKGGKITQLPPNVYVKTAPVREAVAGGKQLPPDRLEIVRFLKGRPPANWAMIQRGTGLSIAVIKQSLHAMNQRGSIVVVDKDERGAYLYTLPNQEHEQ